MLLVIDAGNTNVAFALYAGAERRADWRIRTQPGRTADEFASLLTNLFKARGVAFSDVEACVLASVVPPLTPDLLQLCRAYFGSEPLVVGPGTDLGVEVRYRPASDVGADRLVDAAIALERYGPAPLVLIDIGTATTFNAVGPPNVYLGGAILPGFGLAWDALFERAARLYRVDPIRPPSPLADNTVQAMQAGMTYGAVSLIDGMARRMREALGAPACPVIVTGGGLVDAIVEASETITHVDPFLTLDGLALAGRRSGLAAADRTARDDRVG